MKGMNKFYRQLGRKYGVRGKYVLSRVSPWVGKALFFGGLGVMFYGGEVSKEDIEKGTKYLGIGAATALISGYVLNNSMKLKQMRDQFEEDRQEDKRIRAEIKKNLSNLENSLED